MKTYHDYAEDKHYCRDCKSVFETEPGWLGISLHLRTVMHARRAHPGSITKITLSCGHRCVLREQPGDGTQPKPTLLMSYEEAYEKNDF